jgi:bifunctional non-homologous end joining protein LigD
MSKAVRPGKVLVDWSQNNPAKTTIVPWSLRGRAVPTAATPVTWDEVEAGGLRQGTLAEALALATG